MKPEPLEGVYDVNDERPIPTTPTAALETAVPDEEEPTKVKPGDTATSDADKIAKLEKKCSRSRKELLATQKELRKAQSTIAKLEGLIGSLKSGILYLDRERGSQFLKGQVAAMEALLFEDPDDTDIVFQRNGGSAKKLKKGKSGQPKKKGQKGKSAKNNNVETTAVSVSTNSGTSVNSNMTSTDGPQTTLKPSPTTPPTTASNVQTSTDSHPIHPPISPKAPQNAESWKEFGAKSYSAKTLTQDVMLKAAMERKQGQARPTTGWSLFS
eukprot:Nitzschia sp. Nitz4//scaffold151_size53849//49322//50128//NITZ4_006732-RA/size53849-processed-gene-0.78-mRNA-1//-1//CDS//3329537171//5364//frame0